MWLYVPSACAPAWADLTSDCDSQPMSARSATSNGTSSPQPSSPRGSKTAAWMTLLSGMTLRPSMADRGVAAWISSLPVSPASRSASPDSERAWTTTDSSGAISGESSPRFSLAMSFSRTYQASLPLTGALSSMPSSVPWSPSGSIANGTYSARRKRAPRTAASAGSAWPTPTSSEMANNTTTLPPSTRNGKHGKLLSAEACNLWQTPGTDSFRSRGGNRRDEMALDQQARFWATPRAEHDSGRHRGTTDTLHSQVKSQWPTPNTSNGTGPGSHGTGGDNLQTIASTHQPEATTPDGQTLRRVLNPRFAEMLMGWPPGWTHPCSPIDSTAFAAWETESYRLLRHLRGSNFLVGQGA